MEILKKLNSSYFDNLIIMAGLLIASFGTYHFLSYESAALLVSELEQIAFVSMGTGTRKTEGSLQWNGVESQTLIYNNDQVFANDDKLVMVNMLESKSLITIPVNSLVRISKIENDLNLEVEQGSVLIESTRDLRFFLRSRLGKKRKIEIKKGAKLRVKTTEKSTFINVLRGEASVTLPKGEIRKLTPKKSLNLTKDSAVSLSLKNIVKKREINPLKDKYLKVDTSKDHRVFELAKQPDFKDLVKVKATAGKIKTDHLAAGVYYIRSAQNRNDYDTFSITPPSAPKVVISNLENIDQGQAVELKWSGRKDIKYEVQVTNSTGHSIKKLIVGNSLKYFPTKSGKIKVSVTPFLAKNSENPPTSSKSISLTEKIYRNYKEKLLATAARQKVNVTVSKQSKSNTSRYVNKNSKRELVYEDFSAGGQTLKSGRTFDLKTGRLKFEMSSVIKNGIIVYKSVVYDTQGREKIRLTEDIELKNKNRVSRVLESSVGEFKLVKQQTTSSGQPKSIEFLSRSGAKTQQNYDLSKGAILSLSFSHDQLATVGQIRRVSQHYKKESGRLSKSSENVFRRRTSTKSKRTYNSKTGALLTYELLVVGSASKRVLSRVNYEIGQNSLITKASAQKYFKKSRKLKNVSAKLKVGDLFKDSFSPLSVRPFKLMHPDLKISLDQSVPLSTGRYSKLPTGSTSAVIKLHKVISISSVDDIVTNKNAYQEIVFTKKKVNKQFLITIKNSDGKIVKEVKMYKDRVNLKGMAAGKYLVVVKSSDKNIKLLSQLITVKSKILPTSHFPIVSLTGQGKDLDVKLSWKLSDNVFEIKKFRVLIYKKRAPKKPVVDRVVLGMNMKFKSLAPGNFLWRVLPVGESYTLPSREMKFRVLPASISKTIPKSGTVVMSYNSLRGGCYSFKFPKTVGATRYFVEIYNSLNMKKIIFNRWLKKNEGCWQSSRHGRFFYRYKYFNKWNQQSDFSKLGELIFPISPTTEF